MTRGADSSEGDMWWLKELNTVLFHPWYAGLIPGLRPANERRHYKVTPSLIGAALSKQRKSHYKDMMVVNCWDAISTLRQSSDADEATRGGGY